MVKLLVTGHPDIDSRFPKSGSLSPVSSENLVFAIHALCRNSNWREMFALRQMKCNPRVDSSARRSSASIARRGVEYRPQPGIDSAFHLQEEHRCVAH